MSRSATQKKAHADAIPSIVGNWFLSVLHDPSLEMLDLLEITAQVQSGDHDSISGRVNSDLHGSVYELSSGEVTINSEVSFQVVIEPDKTYTFNGKIDGTTIKGLIKHDGPEMEEGSWSAQAQGGPGEEEEKKHPRKHTKRSA